MLEFDVNFSDSQNTEFLSFCWLANILKHIHYIHPLVSFGIFIKISHIERMLEFNINFSDSQNTDSLAFAG